MLVVWSPYDVPLTFLFLMKERRGDKGREMDPNREREGEKEGKKKKKEEKLIPTVTFLE